MFIDNARKLVFVHIPKTGGTAITRALAPKITNGEVSGDSPPKHWSAARIIMERNVTTDSHTFAAAVRNPWDILVSDYEFCLKHTAHLPKYEKNARLGGWSTKLQRARDKPSFVRFCEEEYLGRPDAWFHYCTDHKGKDLVTFIMRHETLDADFRRLCKEFGYGPVKLPKVNVTEGRRTYRQLFDKHPELITRVGVTYDTYNKRFGYVY